jgi:hypothetical protein
MRKLNIARYSRVSLISSHGMRALGLPNTKHFHEITQIADALARTFFALLSVIFVIV